MHPNTTTALWSFEKVVKKERQLEKARNELSKNLEKMPKSDLPEYYNVTEEIRQKYEE